MKEEGFATRLLKRIRGFVWRTLRDEIKKVDTTENVVDGIDITDYFGGSAIKLSNILPLSHEIVNLIKENKDAIIVGIDRKGFALLGAMLDEIGRPDIKIHRISNINSELVSGKNVILFDDASKTGNTIVTNSEKLLKLGGKGVLSMVVLATTDAHRHINNEIKGKPIQYFPYLLCDPEEYSKHYSAFYDIINASIIPVTGEPVGELKVPFSEIYKIPLMFNTLPQCLFYNVDTTSSSGPIRATLDYLEWTKSHGTEIFSPIIDKTGYFLTPDQAKIRLFFSYDADKMKISYKPIIYVAIPDNLLCKEIINCQQKLGRKPEIPECRDCIHKMYGDIIITNFLNKLTN